MRAHTTFCCIVVEDGFVVKLNLKKGGVRMVFRFIAKLFPSRAKSLQDFIYLAQAAGCTTVAVMPHKRCLGVGIPGAGFFAQYDTAVDDYYLIHIAETKRGKRIVYKEERFSRAVPLASFNREEYERDDLKLFFAAKKRAEDLQGGFSRLVVLLVNEKEVCFDKDACDKRYRRAKELGVALSS